MKTLQITNPITKKGKKSNFTITEIMGTLSPILEICGFKFSSNFEDDTYLSNGYCNDVNINDHKISFELKFEKVMYSPVIYFPSIKLYDYVLGRGKGYVIIPLYKETLSVKELEKIKKVINNLIETAVVREFERTKSKNNIEVAQSLIKDLNFALNSIEGSTSNDYIISNMSNKDSVAVEVRFNRLKVIYTKVNDNWETTFDVFGKRITDFDEYYSKLFSEKDISTLLFTDIVKKY